MTRGHNQKFEADEISWKVPEYAKHERSRAWYITACIAGALLMAYAFFTNNYLFFGIILIGAFVIIMHDGREPDDIKIVLTDDGVVVGRKFYDYDEIKDFSIVYKPKIEVRNLYFEFKTAIRPRLSIPIDGEDPIYIRDYLLKYLPEDLERTDQPTSEGLAKLLKL